MSKIQNKLRDVDPNNSEAVKENVTVFFQGLQKQLDHDHNSWLQELDFVISRFAKFCVPHRIATENYLIRFIDSKNHLLVIKAAKCAQLIQQVRPPNSNAATPKSSWRDHMNSLCTAAHNVIGAIFGNTNNFYNGEGGDDEEKSVSDLPLAKALSKITQVSNAEQKQLILCRRLRNILIMIQAMLVEAYPVGKPIRPQAILDVIVAALNNCRTSKDVDSKHIAELMTQALRTLDALIICLGANLIPFSALVIRIVMQTLKWSSDNQNEASRNVRCIAYASLSGWLSVLHVNKLSDKHVDELTRYVLDDVTVKGNTVTLRENAFASTAKPTGKKSKKKWAKMMNQQLLQSNMSSYTPGEQNKVQMSVERSDDVTIAALECAEIFLTICGIFLKPEVHKLFHERLVKECYNSSSYETRVTLALLRVLEASRKSAPPNVPPPTQYCLQLYSTLCSSPYIEISRFCSSALLDIRLHLHCSPPSLNFAIEAAAESVAERNGKKRMSDRNREVLESLLGEKPSTDTSEEPVPKKTRQEEQSDQISISSDSDNTNETGDDDEDHKWSQEIVIEELSVTEKVIEEINIEPIVIEDADEADGCENDVIVVEGDKNETIKDKDDATQDINEDDDEITATQIIKEINVAETNGSTNIYEAVTQLPADTGKGNNEDIEISDNIEKSQRELQLSSDDNFTPNMEVDQNKDQEPSTDYKKTNGFDKNHSVVVENGSIQKSCEIGSDNLSVEAMLADFVDEINESNDF